MSIIGNIGGQSGGGYGATLTVVSPGPGNKITLSKDGKTREKVTGENGKAVFRGLSTGTWHRVMRNDSNLPAEMDIKIVADYEDIASYFRATINVTYPAGSICTATCGEITLTAPDTSGTWTCIVPNAGEWTVTASTIGGGKTKSVVVKIESDGQTVATTIAYEVVLYSNGTINEITGGFGMAGASLDAVPAINYNDGGQMHVTSVGGGSCGGSAYTKNKIDLTDYTALKFDIKPVKRFDYVRIGASTSTTDAGFVSEVSITENSGSYSTLSVDLSNVNGNHHIVFHFGSGFYGEKNCNVYINNVILV